MLKFRNILVLAGLLLLAAVCGGARAADGTPAVLTGERDALAVARHMTVLVDPEGGWDFQAVRDRFAGRFQPNHSDSLNFGFTGSVIWLRFAVDARGVAGEDWYLVERYPILDHITLFAWTWATPCRSTIV